MHTWINRLLLFITRNRPVREIRINDRRYMERHWLGRVGPMTFYLHRYLGGDGEREVHDHPWPWAVGIPLVGGYDEERLVGMCSHNGWVSKVVKVRPWRWNWIGASTFHRVAVTLPDTWTLFVHGTRFKGWGFLEPCGPDVVYQQPFDIEATKDWHLTAAPASLLRATLPD